MSTTQLSDLITLVQQRANQENNSVFGQQELITYINNSMAELYDILTTTYEDYDSHQFLCTLTGTNTIPILSDVNKIRLVEYQYISAGGGSNTDTYYPIQMYQMPQRNLYGNTPINIFLPYNIAQLRYRVMGAQILIEPLASCAGQYRIWYTQRWQKLVNLTDYIPDSCDTQAWVEYAVVDTCIKMMDKLNIDSSGFRQEKMELKDRIVSAAKNRVTGGPKKMINVRRRRGGNNGSGMGGLF